MHVVKVELYGILRARSGRDSVTVRARSIREALAAAEAACPPLTGLLIDEHGCARKDYRVALNAGSIVTDPDALLAEGDALVLLSAHAGG